MWAGLRGILRGLLRRIIWRGRRRGGIVILLRGGVAWGGRGRVGGGVRRESFGVENETLWEFRHRFGRRICIMMMIGMKDDGEHL
jgi:hypothetical protein